MNPDFADHAWRMRLEFSVARPNAHALVTNIVDTPPLEELVEQLAQDEPESYALLAEFIALKRYRDPRVVGS